MDTLKNVEKIKELEKSLSELLKSSDNDTETVSSFKEIGKKIKDLRNGYFSKLSPWDKVKLARHPERPTSLDYINTVFDDFIELHGDRLFRDDESIVGGIATLNGQPVTVIAQQKGKTTEENIKRNFGMPHPEGYRKALRLMKQAEKFNRPIVTFVDTPGAYPGLGAEERGQGEAIARNLMEMSQLKVPVLAIVVAEGGSGGALALAVANEVYMLENSIYSILSPEGYASILWKDASRANEAAEVMKLTAQDLKEMKIIEKVIEEPVGGAHEFPDLTGENVKEAIVNFLNDFRDKSQSYIIKQRYNKFRDIGEYRRLSDLL